MYVFGPGRCGWRVDEMIWLYQSCGNRGSVGTCVCVFVAVVRVV